MAGLIIFDNILYQTNLEGDMPSLETGSRVIAERLEAIGGMLMDASLWKITPKRLEALGVGLVFLASFWEATMIRESAEAYNRAQFVELNEKLKTIWMAFGQYDLQQFRDFVFKNFDHYFNEFNYIEKYDEFKAKDVGLWQVAQIRWGIFSLGTVMVVAGKWWDGTPK